MNSLKSHDKLTVYVALQSCFTIIDHCSQLILVKSTMNSLKNHDSLRAPSVLLLYILKSNFTYIAFLPKAFFNQLIIRVLLG